MRAVTREAAPPLTGRHLLVLLMAAAVVGGLLLARRLSGPADVSPPVPASSGAASSPAAGASAPAALSPEDRGLTADETRNIEIFRRATASVVNITSIELQRDFFSLDVFEIPRGTGSGFVWDDKGHIVTNFHVIEGARRVMVTLADRSEHEAEVAGWAPDKDLAVLRISATSGRLSPLPLGRSADLAVGQTVLALGNPFGLDHSLTVGVVSAVERELTSPNGRTIRDVIQTDAAINPGNSGGPLLDSQGRLIGVNSAIYSPSGAFAGIGFAVPVDTVRRLVPQLIEHGRPIQPGIGASLISDSRARQLGLEGAFIYQVARGSPADRAGLQGVRRGRNGRLELGDRVVAVNGEAVRSAEDLLHAFENLGVGAQATLTVERGQERRQVRVTLIALE